MFCFVNDSVVFVFDFSNCCKFEVLVVEVCKVISIKVIKVVNLSVLFFEVCMLKIVKKSYDRRKYCLVGMLKVEVIGYV